MRALVTRLRSDRTREKVLVTDWKKPEGPGQFEVLTQTVYSGVTNGTERNDLVGGNYAHKDEELPSGWGYQNVGRVIEVGQGVKSLKIGDILYMSQDHIEYCVEKEDGLHIKLPPEVEPKHAALFGMSSVAMRSCRNANIGMGSRFLIVGAGFIGQMAAQIANTMGTRVTICDIDDSRLKIARKIGAVEEALDVSGDNWGRLIKDRAYDSVLDVAGVKGMEDKLISAAKDRGTVLFIAGRFKVEYTFNNAQFHEINIKQNSHFSNDDLANVCRLTAREILLLEPLIQDVVPVADAKRIYDTLRDTPNKLFGTVFNW